VTAGNTRPRNRRLPLSPLAIGLATIDNKVLEQKKEEKLAIEREKQRKIAAEKKRKAEKERKRKAEVKRKKEEQIKKKKAEEKRKKELAIKKADAKKKKEAEEKKKKEAERKKKLAEEKKRKAAAEKKRKAEAERKRKETAVKKQMEAKAKAARAGQAMSKYVPRIQQKVQDNWNYPPRGPEGCNPTVRVNLAPNGKVLNARIVKSSGDPYCDDSVEKAFLKASPIPIPLDPDLYSEFKTIDFPFRP
jgi:colicin import membrane protein